MAVKVTVQPPVSFKLSEQDFKIIQLSLSFLYTFAGQQESGLPHLRASIEDLQRRLMVNQ